jgi:hypothetical protein
MNIHFCRRLYGLRQNWSKNRELKVSRIWEGFTEAVPTGILQNKGLDSFKARKKAGFNCKTEKFQINSRCFYKLSKLLTNF